MGGATEKANAAAVIQRRVPLAKKKRREEKMITTGVGFLAFITFYTAVILWLARKYPLKLYKVFPPILVIYLLTMVLFTCGMWTMTESVTATKTALVNNMVPCMVFLMSLNCNVKSILKLGLKLLAAFFCATITICMGFVVSYLLFGGALGHPAAEFGAVCASWIGGIQNFLAVKQSLNVPDSVMSNIILMININYSFWIMILVAMSPLAARFNKWTKADVSQIHEISRSLEENEKKESGKLDHLSILMVIGISLMVVAVSRLIAGRMPTIAFINASVWEYVFVSIVGLALGVTKLGKLPGADLVSDVMLTLVMTLLATELNLLQIADAWLYIAAGAIALIVHAILFILLAKVFRLDLHTCGTASIANVGGHSSAPIIAATYHRSYVSISVIMSTVGCVSGTFIGLLLSQLLAML